MRSSWRLSFFHPARGRIGRKQKRGKFGEKEEVTIYPSIQVVDVVRLEPGPDMEQVMMTESG